MLRCWDPGDPTAPPSALHRSAPPCQAAAPPGCCGPPSARQEAAVLSPRELGAQSWETAGSPLPVPGHSPQPPAQPGQGQGPSGPLPAPWHSEGSGPGSFPAAQPSAAPALVPGAMSVRSFPIPDRHPPCQGPGPTDGEGTRMAHSPRAGAAQHPGQDEAHSPSAEGGCLGLEVVGQLGWPPWRSGAVVVASPHRYIRTGSRRRMRPCCSGGGGGTSPRRQEQRAGGGIAPALLTPAPSFLPPAPLQPPGCGVPGQVHPSCSSTGEHLNPRLQNSARLPALQTWTSSVLSWK